LKQFQVRGAFSLVGLEEVNAMSASLNPLKRFARPFWPNVPNTTAPFNPDAQEAVQPRLARMPFAARPDSTNARSWDVSDTGQRSDLAPGVSDGPRLRPPATRIPDISLRQPPDVTGNVQPQFSDQRQQPTPVPPLSFRRELPYTPAPPLALPGPQDYTPVPLVSLRREPQNPTDAAPQSASPDPARRAFFPAEMNTSLSTDTTISPEGVTPRLLRPLPAMPEQPDRTLSVAEAQQNFAQFQRGQRQQRIDELSDPNFKPPKGQGGFKHRLVRGLKVGGEMALENLAQTGNLASAAGAFLGGDAVGTIDRRSQGRYLARKELERLQQAEQYDLGRQGEQAKIADQQSQTALRNAQIPWWKNRPANEQAKQTAQALKNQQTTIKSELSVRLKDPRPFDPNDAYDSDLFARAQAAGVSFDTGAFGDMRNPATMEILDPTDPSGTRKTRVRYNRATGEFEPVTVGDKPVRTGFVQPVIGAGPHAGQTPNQVDVSGDRKRALGQGDKRIGIARERLQVGGAGRGRASVQLEKAATLNRKLDEEKARASHPPQMVNGQPTTDAYRQAYTARHKALALGYMQEIQNAHSNVYEAGVDADGWPYAKPKVQPNGGGADGTYTEEDVRARARKAGKDENAAVEAARKARLIP
jgi:hypothetical protein